MCRFSRKVGVGAINYMPTEAIVRIDFDINVMCSAVLITMSAGMWSNRVVYQQSKQVSLKKHHLALSIPRLHLVVIALSSAVRHQEIFSDICTFALVLAIAGHAPSSVSSVPRLRHLCLRESAAVCLQEFVSRHQCLACEA